RQQNNDAAHRRCAFLFLMARRTFRPDLLPEFHPPKQRDQQGTEDDGQHESRTHGDQNDGKIHPAPSFPALECQTSAWMTSSSRMPREALNITKSPGPANCKSRSANARLSPKDATRPSANPGRHS